MLKISENTFSNIRVRSHVLDNSLSSLKHIFSSVKLNLFFAPKFAFFWHPSDSSALIRSTWTSRHGRVRTFRRGSRLFTWLNIWLKCINLKINHRLFSFAKSDPHHFWNFFIGRRNKKILSKWWLPRSNWGSYMPSVAVFWRYWRFESRRVLKIFILDL